jgi:hypothetical protein
MPAGRVRCLVPSRSARPSKRFFSRLEGEPLVAASPPPERPFFGGIFALSVFATLYLASPIILPVVLAFALKLLLQPVVRLLQRAHLPRAMDRSRPYSWGLARLWVL